MGKDFLNSDGDFVEFDSYRKGGWSDENSKWSEEVMDRVGRKTWLYRS